ncbi:hypothetical protein CRUP_032523 [Coryphaenoides rupestris]|nr:hypothetical protein CRUP_032523 [Coryphaenoides rupestris]
MSDTEELAGENGQGKSIFTSMKYIGIDFSPTEHDLEAEEEVEEEVEEEEEEELKEEVEEEEEEEEVVDEMKEEVVGEEPSPGKGGHALTLLVNTRLRLTGTHCSAQTPDPPSPSSLLRGPRGVTDMYLSAHTPGFVPGLVAPKIPDGEKVDFDEERARKEEEEAKKKADDDAKKKKILGSLSFTGYKVRRRPFCRRRRRFAPPPRRTSNKGGTKRQTEREKKRKILTDRRKELNIDHLKEDRLREKADELWKWLHQLEAEKFDLQYKHGKQKYEVSGEREIVDIHTAAPALTKHSVVG